MKQKRADQIRNNKPKAYLNYVFFDNQLKFVKDGSGIKQVDGEPGELETLASSKVVVKQNGYVYVYTSNESTQDVLFDNLGVTQTTGPVLEETHYYPFGLTMAGISTVAPLRSESKRKFNGIEFNHKEFSDGSGLDLYTAKFRGLDPQIGRWWQIDPETDNLDNVSPYEAMGNNPINDVDPFGDFRTRFGAWLHKLFHGGGEIGKNRLGEYYVAQTKFSAKRGIATLTAKMIYGEGRDQYSAAREKLDKEQAELQEIQRMIGMGVWDPNLTPEEAKRNTINNTLLVAFPTRILRIVSAYVNVNTSKEIEVPEGWIKRPSKKGGGTLYQDPTNPHNSIREMPGNPNSPNAAQQSPYVIFKKEGVTYDVNGMPLKSSKDPAAHIPLNKFDINKMPKF